MLEYIKGRIVQLNPTFVIIEANNLGYLVNISLNTHSKLKNDSESKILVHEVIREDAHLLYGFSDEHERTVFRLLISVSGVGVNTARMMLSTLSPAETENAIICGDVSKLKAIKGIGQKTAERLIVELKDKIGYSVKSGEIFVGLNNTTKEEALSAMVMLGFPKSVSEKVVDRVIIENTGAGVEFILKEALKRL